MLAAGGVRFDVLAALLHLSSISSSHAGAHVEIYGWHGCPDTTMYLSRYSQFMLDAAELSGGEFTLLWRDDTHPRTQMQPYFLPFVACASHVRPSDLAWLGVVACLNPGLHATPGLQECERIAGLRTADSELIARCTGEAALAASLVGDMVAAVNRTMATSRIAFPWVVVDGRALPEPDVPTDGHAWGEGTEDDVAPLVSALCATGTSPECGRLLAARDLPLRVPVVLSAQHGRPGTTRFLGRLLSEGVARGLSQVANLTVVYRGGTHPGTQLQPDFLPFIVCAQRQYPPGSLYESLLGVDQSPAWLRVAVCAQDGTSDLAACAEREEVPLVEYFSIRACMDDEFMANMFVTARDADSFGAAASFPWATVDGEAVDIDGDDPTPIIRRVCAAADPRLPRPEACRVSQAPLAVLFV